jgi:hypothetical protein
VDTLDEINNLGAIVNTVMLTAANSSPSPALSIADLAKLGLDMTGVTTANLPTLLASIAATVNTGDAVDTVAKLQALITGLDKTVPVFSSPTSATSYSDSPLSTVVYDAQASDNGQASDVGLHYSLSGTDASRFVIDAATGEMRFSGSVPAYVPGGANSYGVTVSATDAAGNHAERDVTVNLQFTSPNSILGTTADDLIDQTYTGDPQGKRPTAWYPSGHPRSPWSRHHQTPHTAPHCGSPARKTPPDWCGPMQQASTACPHPQATAWRHPVTP